MGAGRRDAAGFRRSEIAGAGHRPAAAVAAITPGLVLGETISWSAGCLTAVHLRGIEHRAGADQGPVAQPLASSSMLSAARAN